jgi:hypothetical protein
MGYNVLSGSTSAVNVISSGSFIGDGSGLDNVEQFPLQNSSVTRIPFYKTIDGKLGLNANSGFTFDASTNTLTVPAMTSSVGVKLSNPRSSSIAGPGSFLGIDTNGNLVITASGGIQYGRRAIISHATISVGDTLIGISASASLEVRLPSAADYKNGQYFLIKDEGGNSNLFNITIKTSGSQTIDGENSIILESPYSSINLYSDGTSKFFIY